jgi:hypothetical protein
MVSRLELPSGDEGWVSARGELSIRHPAPGIVVFVEKGWLSAEFAQHILKHSDQALEEADKVQLFVDCFALDGYDPEIRNGGSAWLKKHAARVTAQHMLVRSRLTKMGLSVVSLALGGLIKGHHERRTFDGDLASAIRLARASGVVPATK